MKNETRGEHLFTGTAFILLGLVVSALTYGGIFIVALAVCGMHGITHTRWAHVAACSWLVAATFAAVRTAPDYWTAWRWNVKGPKDVPDGQGEGWNLIPYGPDTIRSMVKIISALFVTGPQFVVAGLQEMRAAWKGKDRANTASHGTALPRRP